LKYIQVPSSQYLNNLIDRDHRAINADAPRWETPSRPGARAITLTGMELLGRLKQLWDRALA
jgi:transposase-like protein